MITTAINQIETSIEQLLLIDRFILTQVANKRLVFPATWVVEILRTDRSDILTLPFYNPLMVGVVNLNGQTISLLNTAHLLKLTQVNLPERIVVVRVDRSQDGLKNIGFIVDRLIGDTSRSELPSDLFTTYQSEDLIMLQSHLIPPDLWEPQNLLVSK